MWERLYKLRRGKDLPKTTSFAQRGMPALISFFPHSITLSEWHRPVTKRSSDCQLLWHAREGERRRVQA
eukprot:6213818-Pleurochrysis_carterae.AAC.2